MAGNSPDVLGQTKKRFKSIFRKKSKDPSSGSPTEEPSKPTSTTKDESKPTSTSTSPPHPEPGAAAEPTKTSVELADTEPGKRASIPAQPAPAQKPAVIKDGKTDAAPPGQPPKLPSIAAQAPLTLPATASSTNPSTTEKPSALGTTPAPSSVAATSATDPSQGPTNTTEPTKTSAPTTDVTHAAMSNPVTKENTSSTEDIVGGKPAHEHSQNTPGSTSNPTMSATSGPLEDHPII